VPVLTAGEFQSHNSGPFVVQEEELDQIIEGSNLLQPVIREAIHSGAYRGNDDVTAKLTKPIPGLLNLKHQAILPDTLKEAVKQVSTSFRKAVIDGKNWIVQRFEHVPDDIAKTLQAEFPFRSIEALPLTDPESGTHYPKVIRSTAFLDKFTPPAVPGQTPDLVVEFAGAASPVITLITHNKETNIMPNTQAEPVDVAELQRQMQAMSAARDNEIADLKARIESSEKARQETVELALEQEKAKDAKIAELQAAQDKAEATHILTEMQQRGRTYHDRSYLLSPATIDVITPWIEGKGVVELQDGESPRHKFVGFVESLIELAGKNALLVPMELQGGMTHIPPNTASKTKEEKINELMQKEGKTYGDAWVIIEAQELAKEDV
jgi:hypothetical protein